MPTLGGLGLPGDGLHGQPLPQPSEHLLAASPLTPVQGKAWRWMNEIKIRFPGTGREEARHVPIRHDDAADPVDHRRLPDQDHLRI